MVGIFRQAGFLTSDTRNIVLQTVRQPQVYTHSTSDSIRIPRYLSQLSPPIGHLCKTMPVVFKIRYMEPG